MEKPVYRLHATAIVGCGISLFFCVLSLVAFYFFRPKAESMLIKKHLTIALAATQVFFLISIEVYQTKVGCQILSVLMHFTASACFTWCTLDALGLYFFHSNKSPAVRNTRCYFIAGWGIPSIVVVLTLLIGFLDATSRTTISFYTCWSSDNIIWSFVVSSIVLAVANTTILIVILKQLRQPSYDISLKAAIEKRGTRYGLRTNSLLLLGLCVGWIFAVLSFTDGNNLRYQLTFGLVNGLQGIFVFFFHCLLNSDHVKGYSGGSKKCLSESGRSPTSESTRSKREEVQSGGSGRRKGGSRNSKLENVPLISVSNISKTDDKSDCANDQPVLDSPPLVKSESIHVMEKDNVIRHEASISPDHDVIPQLPGTPDQQIEHRELLSSAKGQRRRDGNDRNRNKRPKTADNQLQVYHTKIDNEKRRKSSSEPTISSGQFDTSKGRERAQKRVPCIQGDYFPDVRPKANVDRPHNSTNELESLFSGRDSFTKRSHCSSLSSLPTRERRIPNQQLQRKSSSTTDARAPIEESAPSLPPRNAQETIL